MNSINLTGRLTKDPELRYTQSAEPQAVAKFSLAVERNYTKPDGLREVDFFDVIAWRKTAEFISKYFIKGMRVALTGRLQQRRYEHEGKNRSAVEVVAENVYFADGKKPTDNGEPMPDNFDPMSPAEGSDDVPFQ
jgi:single-strand DNA-binding protein